MYNKINQELIEFIQKSPSCYQAVENISGKLIAEGYIQLPESEEWKLESGGKYFVTRNCSSIIAFRIPKEEFNGFLITASHSDSPSFKIKSDPEILSEGCYIKLNTEKYGGSILSTWLDRPLSVAGQVVCKTEEGVSAKSVMIEKDMLIIPNIAIHMNNELNKGYVLNPQKDMLPLFGDETAKNQFIKTIAKEIDVKAEDILGYDLFLYCRDRGCILGNEGEFVASPRLDDLQSAFATLKGFIESEENKELPVYCVFDNEEIGSGTRQGAASTFLADTLSRICEALRLTHSVYLQKLASSFMLSVDNAHAIHPNQPDKADLKNRPKLNGGVVIKQSASKSYATDAIAEAVFKKICNKAKVPVQNFANRSDIPGGSTLGHISTKKVSVTTIDIGLAQLAMHSAYETAGAKDTFFLSEAVKAFYSAYIRATNDGTFIIKEG